MAGRIAVGVLLTFCLLLSGNLSAQEQKGAGSQPGPATREQERLEQRLEQRLKELEAARTEHEEATRSITREQERLKQRLEELEAEKAAQEEATRSIIRESLSGLGSRINEFVIFGGTLEVLAGWQQNFQRESEKLIELNTAEIDFEIQVNPWTIGSLILQFDDGKDVEFPTTSGTVGRVDRITVDTAFLTIGDTQRFPAFGTLGQIILPFGISTGDPVADVLTLEDPLTLQVFEMREEAILLGMEFPTPPLRPASPMVSPPSVRPMLFNPMFSKLGQLLGYRPFPTPPPPQVLTTPPPSPPPFHAGAYLFNGETVKGDGGRGFRTDKHWGATAGYRTKVNCRPSHRQQRMPNEPQLGWLHFFCPMNIQAAVDFNRSVFDSRFLIVEYSKFLNQIGFVPGMAANAKANLGPLALVAEWNAAIEHASFIDDVGRSVRIRPRAWQVSLNYQFDWNPWVEAIGLQGTYLAFGYSESQDMAGVTQNIGTAVDPTNVRVGFVPKRRFLVDVGEWVLDGLRIAFEYSQIWDYSRSKGGTGNTGYAAFWMTTYEW